MDDIKIPISDLRAGMIVINHSGEEMRVREILHHPAGIFCASGYNLYGNHWLSPWKVNDGEYVRVKDVQTEA